MKRLFNVFVYVVFGIVIVGWLDRGMRWFLKTYDPVFRRILMTKEEVDISQAKERVFAILKNQNGQVETV